MKSNDVVIIETKIVPGLKFFAFPLKSLSKQYYNPSEPCSYDIIWPDGKCGYIWTFNVTKEYSIEEICCNTEK